ncbi:putative Eukaryotic translation initiation factor eIF2A [Trypanosoma vivax]|uniref:Putative translation initiation factor n=1 Tax=Trypanosoma vivax (strain Y486) TaxID=1055687 RepID=G0TVM1_TRYVY|nr:putative translation initiation factor [Trypanosoma vivax]KAH8620421.1 putative Eukaryotic translation initiation factor eIF2A [Trypanosoma vivax]CCC47987.1 putative translation initiation factor [Trypanosoma vivax Y486]
MSEDNDMSRNIIVNGLPNNVTPEKRLAFQKHMTKKVAEVLGHGQFSIHLVPDEETELITGAFISFGTVAQAEDALARLNLYHITKTDVFTTYRWSALQAAGAPAEEYVPPEVGEDVDTDLVHTMAEDPMVRPQFFIKQGESFDIEWYWYNYSTNKIELYRKPSALKTDSVGQWTEMDRRQKRLAPGLVYGTLTSTRPMPAWSTYGRLVISQHKSGIKIWGGRQMNMLFEVQELDINAFLVSPQEKYLVVKTLNDVSVWDIHEAKKIRTLGGLDLVDLEKWPITRYNAKDDLVAISQASDASDRSGKLFIYRADTMRVLQGAPATKPMSFTFAVPGLKVAEWNPVVAQQMAIIADSGPEQGWKIIIQNLIVTDNRVEARTITQRNYMRVERLDLLWHPQGTHLVVKLTKPDVTEYVVFVVGANDAAEHHLPVERHLSAGRFAWRPSGPHFAIIFDDQKKNDMLGDKSVIRVYSIDKKIAQLASYTTSATYIFWAPRGSRLVAANYEKSTLQFYSINDRGSVVVRERVTAPVTDTAWDPTGRFFASWVSVLRATGDHQFRVFDMNGRELMQKQVRQLSHFSWRPLAESLLTPAEVQKVRENLREYSKRYQDELDKQKEREMEEENRKLREKEEKYVKRMHDIAQHHAKKGLTREREELVASSRWNRWWASRLKSLPADEMYVKDFITEERIIQQRLLDQ